MGTIYKLSNINTGAYYIGYSSKTPTELKKSPPRPQQAEYVWRGGKPALRFEVLEEASSNLPLLRNKWRAHYSKSGHYRAQRDLIIQRNDKGEIVDSFENYDEFADKYDLKVLDVIENQKKYGLKSENFNNKGKPIKRDSILEQNKTFAAQFAPKPKIQVPRRIFS